VSIRYGTTVGRIEISGSRASAVITDTGERIATDVVVVNADLPTAAGELLPPGYAPRRIRRLQYSPSAVVLNVGSAAEYEDATHHTIEFGGAWDETFAQVVDRGELMSDPSFFDVVLRQRACRSFAPDAVPDTDIERILTAATHAPSAENMQPWVFVVVRDREILDAIGALARSLWEGTARAYAEPHLDPAMLASVDASVKAGFGGAPALVVVGVDTTSGVHVRAAASSIFPAVQNLLLAASALGYGSALTTLTTIVADQLRALIDLPDDVTPMAVIPIGRPARTLGPPRREPITSKTHRDRYGTAW
jgi:nitroreductase